MEFPKIEEFRNDSQDTESSGDGLEVEVYNENMNNSMNDQYLTMKVTVVSIT